MIFMDLQIVAPVLPGRNLAGFFVLLGVLCSFSFRCALINREKMVVGEGFEPSKSVTADLQSAPFGRSGTPPLALLAKRLSR